MKASEITTPGLYRYRRDSHLPWEFKTIMKGWAHDAPDNELFMVKVGGLQSVSELIGEAHGPIEPDPEKDVSTVLIRHILDTAEEDPEGPYAGRKHGDALGDWADDVISKCRQTLAQGGIPI